MSQSPHGHSANQRNAKRRLIAPSALACGLFLFALPGAECTDINGNTNNNVNSNAIDPRCPPPEPADEATTVSYASDVRPLLQSHGCLSGGCHGGSFPSSGYSLRNYNPSFGPGDDAVALDECDIVPGDAAASFLVEKLRADPRRGARMPLLREPLSDEEIAIIETWIDEGAKNN